MVAHPFQGDLDLSTEAPQRVMTLLATVSPEEAIVMSGNDLVLCGICQHSPLAKDDASFEGLEVVQRCS